MASGRTFLTLVAVDVRLPHSARNGPCPIRQHMLTNRDQVGTVPTMTKTRAERAAALETWADAVDPADLRSADTDALRHIAELTQQRDDVDAELTQTVHAARAAHRSWSEIGAMLGVSKQAAQRRYGTKTPA